MPKPVLADPVLEEFRLILQKVCERKPAIIVEGKKDKSALVSLGISANQIYILNKKPLFAVAEEVTRDYAEALILSDLDSEGKRLYSRLNVLLQHLGVGVDDALRNFLFKHTKLRQIEGLGKIAEPPTPPIIDY